MSYDKKIELQLKHLAAYGVPPILHDLETCLPKSNKEPEPKILLRSPNSFEKIRALFCLSENAFMIPGLLWAEKNPLVSILLDTKENGVATSSLAKGHHSLRFRYEINPETGKMTQRDYNEKSSIQTSRIIGGCADRDEREIEVPMTQSLRDGFESLKDKYRQKGDIAYCDSVPYENLHVLGGYTAARTEYGFAVKHPIHNVMIAFEACEDIFETYNHDMSYAMAHLFEFEFEPRQVWGELPEFAKTPQGFKHFLYSAMNDVRNHLCMALGNDAVINTKSKADYVKDGLLDLYGMDDQVTLWIGEELAHLSNKPQEQQAALSDHFSQAVAETHGATQSETFSLSLGDTLSGTLENCARSIVSNATRLHTEKTKINRNMIQPNEAYIAAGSNVIEFATPLDTRQKALVSGMKPVARIA